MRLWGGTLELAPALFRVLRGGTAEGKHPTPVLGYGQVPVERVRSRPEARYGKKSANAVLLSCQCSEVEAPVIAEVKSVGTLRSEKRRVAASCSPIGGSPSSSQARCTAKAKK